MPDQHDQIQDSSLQSVNEQQESHSNKQQGNKKKNETGIPDRLKAVVEHFSGFSLDEVRVHYNSEKPAAVGALAYTEGLNIYIAPGQEKHLAHELWHVVQQMKGEVSATTEVNGKATNDEDRLEQKADRMGEKASTTEGNLDTEVPQKQMAAPSIEQNTPIQRKISGENSDATGYDDMTVETVLGYLNDDPNPAETPGLEEIITTMVNDGETREIDDGAKFVNNLRRIIVTALVDDYIANTRGSVPNLLPILTPDNITSLSIYVGLSQYDTTELNELIGEVRAHEHIHTDSVTATVRKFIPALDGPNGKLRNVERANFVQGRTGEMIGLIGELRSVLATTEFSGESEVHLGYDVDLGNEQAQDVDIYYETDTNSFNIEVAATVSKLRDKLNSEPQRARYDQIKENDQDAILVYAVGDSNIWPDIFAGPHLVNNLVRYERHLQVDGVRWSPRELKALAPVMRNLLENFIPSMETDSAVAQEGLASLDPNLFTGKSVTEAERLLGQALTRDGRIEDNYNWYKKARDHQRELFNIIKGVFSWIERSDSSDSRTMRAFKNIALTEWNTQKPLLRAVCEPLMALNESRDLSKYRSELKKVGTGLKRIHKKMSDAISQGYDAMAGRKNDDYHKRIVDDATEEFKRIDPKNYDELSKR